MDTATVEQFKKWAKSEIFGVLDQFMRGSGKPWNPMINEIMDTLEFKKTRSGSIRAVTTHPDRNTRWFELTADGDVYGLGLLGPRKHRGNITDDPDRFVVREDEIDQLKTLSGLNK